MNNTLGLLVGSLAFGAMTAIMVIHVHVPLAKCLVATTEYETTDGQLLTNSIHENRDSDGGTSYRIEASYTYTVDGKSYKSDRYDFFSETAGIGDHRYADHACTLLRWNEPLSVYYDPADPSRAVLSLDVPNVVYLVAFACQAFFAITIVLAYGVLTACLKPRVPDPNRLEIADWGPLRHVGRVWQVTARRHAFGSAIAAWFVTTIALSMVLGALHVISGVGPVAIASAFVATSVATVCTLFHTAFRPRPELILDLDRKTAIIKRGSLHRRIPFEEIKRWTLRTIGNPRFSGMSPSATARLLAISVLGSDPVPIYVFLPTMFAADLTPEEAARKLAEITGKKLKVTDNVGAVPTRQPGLLGAIRFRRAVCSRSVKYKHWR